MSHQSNRRQKESAHADKVVYPDEVLLEDVVEDTVDLDFEAEAKQGEYFIGSGQNVVQDNKFSLDLQKAIVKNTRSQQFALRGKRSDPISEQQGILSRSAAENAVDLPSYPFSPTAAASNHGPGLKGLRSIFGSQARLGNQTGTSQINRHSLRFTAKVNQIKPPESEEEQEVNSFGSSEDKWSEKAQEHFYVGPGPRRQPFEEPLNEEPLPEQKSHQQRQEVRLKQSGPIRASNDFIMGPLEAPPQPRAHDIPPDGVSVSCPSKCTSFKANPEPNQVKDKNVIEQLQQDKLDALKVQNAQIDPLENNLVTSNNGQEESEESDDVQFRQDVLFTNANSSPQFKHSQPPSMQQARRYPIQGGTLRENKIRPNQHNEEYVRLKQHLEDSNVFFLNPLRREFDKEEQFSQVADPQFAGDQTSFPGISAIMQTINGEVQFGAFEEASCIFSDSMIGNNLKNQKQTKGKAADRLPRHVSSPRNVGQVNARGGERNDHVDSMSWSVNANGQQMNIRKKQSAVDNKIRQNLMSELDIHRKGANSRGAPSRAQTRPYDSILPEMVAADDRSIMVDSAEFGESKLLNTERRVLQYAEWSKENVKLSNGLWLQESIRSAQPNDVIFLQSTNYKFHSLHIENPITLVGQPETVLEVDGGAIYIDFSKDEQPDEQGAQEFSIDQVQTLTPMKIGEPYSNTYRDKLMNHPLSRGTPLTIKKSKVARIQVCEIRFNRTKASLQQRQRVQSKMHHASQLHQGQTEGDKAAQDTELQHFSHEISLGATHNAQNMGQQLSQTLLREDKSHQGGEWPQAGPISCFIIEQHSFIEVKDCFIKSVCDKNNFDQELDFFFRNKAQGAPRSANPHQQSTTAGQYEKTASNDQIQAERIDFLEQMRRQDCEIRDYCFTLNLPELGQDRTSAAKAYSGLVSLCSTTIQNFMYGVYCGPEAILTCEASSFIQLRAGGCAIIGQAPKLLKVMNGSIQKCEADGIRVVLDEIKLPPMSDYFSQSQSQLHLESTLNKHQYEVQLTTEHADQDFSDAYQATLQRLTRKVYIENNRMVQVAGCAILVEGPAKDHYLQYLVKVKDNRISNCGLDSKLYAIPGASDPEKEIEKEMIKQAYDRIGGEPKACIYLRNLHIYELSCFRNTISKGSGSGITIQNVKGHREDMTQITSLPTTDQEAQTVYERCVGDEQRVTVIDNYVIEISEGYGMVIDASTCFMELNQLKKNAYGGLLITTSTPVPRYLTKQKSAKDVSRTQNQEQPHTHSELNVETARSFGILGADGSDRLGRVRLLSEPKATTKDVSQLQLTTLRLSQIKHFCSVTLDQSTAMNNLRFGIGVLGFYGTVSIKNTQCIENETDGMVFSRQLSDTGLHGRVETLNDEAQFIEFGDCTERSSRPVGLPNRSENVIVSSYQESPLEKPHDLQVIKMDKPFEKQASTVYLLKCFVQQNRQDGLKIVELNVQALGCLIQGNMGSAIRLCNGGDCEIYMKSRNNDTDLIGQVYKGYNGARVQPKIKIDANLTQLLQDICKCAILQCQVEMIQMQQQEPQTDLRISSLRKSSEQKLINQIESQRSIMEQRDPQKQQQNKNGFFSFLACCFSPKAQRGDAASAPVPIANRKHQTQKAKQEFEPGPARQISSKAGKQVSVKRQ